jgi:hypothetical protein
VRAQSPRRGSCVRIVVLFLGNLPIVGRHIEPLRTRGVRRVVLIDAAPEVAHAFAEAPELADDLALHGVPVPQLEVVGAPADRVARGRALPERQLSTDRARERREVIEHGCLPAGGLLEAEQQALRPIDDGAIGLEAFDAPLVDKDPQRRGDLRWGNLTAPQRASSVSGPSRKMTLQRKGPSPAPFPLMVVIRVSSSVARR